MRLTPDDALLDFVLILDHQRSQVHQQCEWKDTPRATGRKSELYPASDCPRINKHETGPATAKMCMHGKTLTDM